MSLSCKSFDRDFRMRFDFLVSSSLDTHFMTLNCGSCCSLDIGYSWIHTIGMKTAISLPDQLFQSADAAAKVLGLSRSALIQKALEDFLESQSQKSIIEKLNRVYSKVDSSVPFEIKKYQSSHIQNEEW